MHHVQISNLLSSGLSSQILLGKTVASTSVYYSNNKYAFLPSH